MQLNVRFLACRNDEYGMHTHAICTVPKLKLNLIRSFLYQRIFSFCFLLLVQNSSLYYTVALIPASGFKNGRIWKTRNSAPRGLLESLLFLFIKRGEQKASSKNCNMYSTCPSSSKNALFRSSFARILSLASPAHWEKSQNMFFCS